MKKNNDIITLRSRSSGSCIATGYRLFTSIFRRVFRSSWPVAIIYGLSMALLSGYTINHIIPLMGLSQIVDPETTHTMWVKVMTTWGAFALLFVLCAVALASYGFSAMREHLQTGLVSRAPHWYGRYDWPTLGRVAVTQLWVVLIAGIVCGGIAVLWRLGVEHELTTLRIGAAVIGIILTLLMLPLCYTIYKKVLGQSFNMTAPLKGYLAGLGQIGTLFVVVLVTAIITLLMTLVIELPAIILYAANIQSQIGTLHGDETGMPTSIGWLSFCVFWISGFIEGYVHLSTLFPLYFAYGSIENEQQERRKGERLQAVTLLEP